MNKPVLTLEIEYYDGEKKRCQLTTHYTFETFMDEFVKNEDAVAFDDLYIDLRNVKSIRRVKVSG